MTKTRWVAAGAAVGLMAVTGCGTTGASSAKAPPAARIELTSAVRATPAASKAAKAPALVIRITGSGRSSDITWDIDNQESQRTGSIRLPWKHTDTNYAAVHSGFGVVVLAQNRSGKPRASITCVIRESGRQVSKQTSRGPYAIAECSTS